MSGKWHIYVGGLPYWQWLLNSCIQGMENAMIRRRASRWESRQSEPFVSSPIASPVLIWSQLRMLHGNEGVWGPGGSSTERWRFALTLRKHLQPVAFVIV